MVVNWAIILQAGIKHIIWVCTPRTHDFVVKADLVVVNPIENMHINADCANVKPIDPNVFTVPQLIQIWIVQRKKIHLHELYTPWLWNYPRDKGDKIIPSVTEFISITLNQPTCWTTTTQDLPATNDVNCPKPSVRDGTGTLAREKDTTFTHLPTWKPPVNAMVTTREDNIDNITVLGSGIPT